MKIRAYFKSLGFRLVAIILLSFMVPTLVLGLFTGTVLFRSIEEKTERSLLTGAEHAAQLTMNNVARIITLAKDVTYDGILTAATEDYVSGRTERYDDYFMIVRAYLDPKFGREGAVRFAAFYRVDAPKQLIIGRLGQVSNTAGQADIFMNNAFESVQALTQTLDTKVAFYQSGEDTYLIRNLYNARLERFGVLVLGVDMDNLLAPLMAEADKWGGQMALRLSGYAAGDAAGIEEAAQGILDREGRVHLTRRFKGADLTLFYRLTLQKAELYQEVTAFRRLLFGLLFILVPLLTGAMIFIDRRILKPVHILAAAASRIETGEWGVTVPMRGEDELGSLGRAFSDMSVRLKNLIETSYLKEIALRDARIDALQSRINPHFMNNALEMINWEARMDGEENISEMVEALSILLNAAMDRDNEHMVPLKTELELADAYFYFIKLRYGDKLTIDKHVADGAEDIPVPRLVIQTLLENANEHGLAPAGGGQVLLNVFTRYERLFIEVVNTGKKLSPEEFRRIADIVSGREEGGRRLGLTTTAQRLKLIYDGQATLRAAPGPRGETVFTVSLPITQTNATNNMPSQ